MHNISKTWTQSIYRFWDIADLGCSQSYFSCQKYQESDHVSITKVVALITSNPTKLSLHFLNVLQFSTHFTSLRNLQTLLEIHFALRTLERIGAKQCGPWPWPAAREAKFRRLRRGDRPGKVGRGARGSPRISLRVWSGWRRCGWWRAAAATGTRRRASCFDEITAGAREWVAREAIVDARGGGGGLGWVCSRPEP
jgi:hypothetical protein